MRGAALIALSLAVGCASSRQGEVRAAVAESHQNAVTAIHAQQVALEQCKQPETLSGPDEATEGDNLLTEVTTPPAGQTWQQPAHPLAVSALLRRVTGALAPASTRPELSWVASGYGSPEVMVQWSLGGYVAVSHGALQAASDEAELAAMLAHAMAHEADPDNVRAFLSLRYRLCVAQAYAASGMTGASGIDTEWAQLAARDLTVGKLWGQGQLRQPLRVNADQELVFDAQAMKMLANAGYPLAAYAPAMAKLEANTAWAKAHPPSDSRREAVAAAVKNGKQKAKKPAPLPKEVSE